MFLRIQDFFSDIFEAFLGAKSSSKVEFLWRNYFGAAFSPSFLFNLDFNCELFDTVNVDKTILNNAEHVLE